MQKEGLQLAKCFPHKQEESLDAHVKKKNVSVILELMKQRQEDPGAYGPICLY